MSADPDDGGGGPKNVFPMGTDPQGRQMLAMPYDESLAQKAVEEGLATKTGYDHENNTGEGTPTPEGDHADQQQGDEGGPVRRFNDLFTDLGSVQLEAMGLDGYEIANSVATLRDEMYRSQFPIIERRFVVKCVEEDCGAEYDHDAEFCMECARNEMLEDGISIPPTDPEEVPDQYRDHDVRPPNPSQKKRAERSAESVNKEGQSLRELMKSAEDSQSLLGVSTVVVRKTYSIASGDTAAYDRGEVIHEAVDELVKGDPKRLVPVVDENGRIGNYWWTCPVHRDSPVGRQQHEDGHRFCEECGAELREVYFAEMESTNRRRDAEAKKYFFDDEVVSWARHYPRLNGLDGLSPVHHIWLKQAVLHWMDIYGAAFFDPESDSYPNKFMVVHTTNRQAWEKQFEKAEDEASGNPYSEQILMNEYSGESNSTPEVQVIDLMSDDLLGQNQQIREQFKQDIRTNFGVTNVFDSDLSDAGGLNNEGLQMEVTDRAIATAMNDTVAGPLDELTKVLGIDDYKFTFIPPQEGDADDLQQQIKTGTDAVDAGLEAELEDGKVKVKDGDFEAAEEGEGGGLADLFGDFSGTDSPVDQKAKQYIDDPADLQPGKQIQVGPRGGVYYDTDDNEGTVGATIDSVDFEAGDVTLTDDVGISRTFDIPDDAMPESDSPDTGGSEPGNPTRTSEEEIKSAYGGTADDPVIDEDLVIDAAEHEGWDICQAGLTCGLAATGESSGEAYQSIWDAVQDAAKLEWIPDDSAWVVEEEYREQAAEAFTEAIIDETTARRPGDGEKTEGAPEQKADPMANGHGLDPATGEGVCENTGEAIEAETMGDLTEDCPHCGEALSHVSEKAALAEKAAGWGADVFWVLASEDCMDGQSPGDLLGVAVDMPESDCYVDWKRDAFPDPLEDPHVSIYGSVDDLTTATSNRVVPAAEVAADAGAPGGGAGAEPAGEPEATHAPDGGALDRGDDERSRRGGTGNADSAVGGKSWAPYEGPRGGSGWVNAETGDVVYQEEAPGDVLENEEDVRSAVLGADAPDAAIGVADYMKEADSLSDIPDGASTIRSDGQMYYADEKPAEVESAERVVSDATGADVNLGGLKPEAAATVAKKVAAAPPEAAAHLSRITTTKDDLPEGEKGGLTQAHVDHSGNLYISPGLFSEETADQDSEWNEEGIVEYDGPGGTITHELGHAAHYGKLDEEGLSRFGLMDGLQKLREHQDVVREDMSEYALENEMELVAEVFTRLGTGGEVEPETMEVFEAMRGVEP